MTSKRNHQRKSSQRLLTTGLAFCALVCPKPALAEDDAIEVQVRHQVMLGQEAPAVLVHLNQSAKQVVLTLNGPKKFRETKKKVAAGQDLEFKIPAPVGVTGWRGQLEVTFDKGSPVAMPLELEIEVADGFEISVKDEHVSTSTGHLKFSLDRKAGRCQVAVYAEGKEPTVAEAVFAGEKPGTLLDISWRPDDPRDIVLKLELNCWDDGEIFDTGIELFPWKIEIPHEDVVFESGQSTISELERPKLDQAFKDISQVVGRYKRFAAAKKVTLFVEGHTDSVGARSTNRSLSERRAKAIAQYFKDKGMTLRIRYAGFGEDALAVETPDETDQPLNRRAVYVVSIMSPRAARWRGL